MNKKIRILKSEPLLFLALPMAIFSLMGILLIRPFIKIRIGFIHSDRIGHFAANTELCLCEKDLNQENKYLDLFYFPRKPCNRQLALMWSRTLLVLPWFFMRPIDLIVRTFICLSFLRVNDAKYGDFDADNLYDKTLPHLRFTQEEEKFGVEKLLELGIKEGDQFVCLLVRDSSYLKAIYPNADTSYHNFRDTNIQDYVLAAEELANRGYYVIRMGAHVGGPMICDHPRVIDYACNGMRSDFMDIYLGAKCFFTISTGSGWDAVPLIFRKPVCFVNYLSLMELPTWRSCLLGITKKHVWINTGEELKLAEIFSNNVGLVKRSSTYENNGVKLIDNTPEEIRDVAIEMCERLRGSWVSTCVDKNLQTKFWEIFPTNYLDENGIRYHGEIRSNYGANFLRNNPGWVG
jgi:putative glycosyltransferase (TIGR04372 family)